LSKASELFEKVSHPTRVKILKLLEASPMNFSQLKDSLGIESSGNLDHHLKKLVGLVYLDSDGVYKISGDGLEAVKAIKSVEFSLALKEAYPVAQSRRVFGVFLMLLAFFIFAVTASVVAVLPETLTSQQLIGLVGGILGAIVGMLGAALGLRGSIMADGRSSRPMTFFPSQKDPWTSGDWAANLLFFGSSLALMFSLIYIQMLSADFAYKPLWFASSVFAMSILSITSIMISYRIIEKANRKLETSK